MASISSLGAGSGLDLQGILTSLMQVEQQPLFVMQQREASYQARISALGSLQGALSSLQTAAGNLTPPITKTATDFFSTLKASVADSSIASATTSTLAVPGSYSLEVTKLAQAQRLVTPTTAGYVDASSVIASGTLTLEIGEWDGSTFTASKSVEIASGGTLGELRDAINEAKTGVTATILTTTAGAQLVLTSSGTGSSNVLKLSDLTGFEYDPDPTSTTNTLTDDTSAGGQKAQDAAFSVNGMPGTSSTNSVSGVLDGITLKLLKTTTSGSPTTLSVTRDTSSSLNASLTAFVKSYNDANKLIGSLGAYDAATKAVGALQGEATLRTTQIQIRNMLFSEHASGSANYKRLSDIGISAAKDGSLSLDSTKLNQAAAADFDSVANLVADVGKVFKAGIEGLVGTSGSITAATDSSKRMIADLTKRQQVMSDRLTKIENMYRKQFTALDTLVASMNKTSSYLTQQLANLPGSTYSSRG